MKKLFALFLCLVMVFSLAACGTQENTSSKEDTVPSGEAAQLLDNGRYPSITATLSMDVENLEPKDPNAASKMNIYWMIYESLFDIDDNGSFVPSIGKDLTIINDTTYSVEIYDCVYDSAGNHITADDVVYSVYWLVNSGNALKYDFFESVEATGEFTVEFHWNSAPSALSDLEFPLGRTFIFSQKAFEDGNFSSNPIGTGSYTVTNYVAGSVLVLEANDNYWALKDESIMNERLDIHRANVQTIEYKVITEASQASISLEKQEADYCDYITAAAISKFEEGGQYSSLYNVNTEMSGDFYVVVPNCHRITDVNLRLAIFYALDNSAIAQVMGGSYTALSVVGTSFFNDYVPEWEDLSTYNNTYDPDLAKEYLAKSNYAGENIRIVCQSNEADKNAATMIQTLLTQIGITSSIDAMDSTLFKTRTSELDTWELEIGTVGGATMVGAYNRLYSNTVHTIDGVGYTLGMIRDDKLQQLYTTANADATHDAEHLTELNNYVLDNAYMYALAGLSSSRVYTKDISKLYFREGHAVTLGPSEYLNQQATHSTPRVVLDKIESNGPTGYAFYADDGTVWDLNIAADDSWILYVGDEVYTGDKNFPGDADDIIMTTPPNEGAPAAGAAFYEESGVCKWKIIDAHNMVPVNYPDIDGYIARLQSGEIGVSNEPSGYKYVDTDGTIYILSIAGDDSWTLYVNGDIYTGDKSFPGQEENIVMTTPPNEGVPANADFFEADGVCKWRILDNTSMIPLNRES
ncbi:MAG: ABC transporter substrate-binding protein [Faecousia sp.]